MVLLKNLENEIQNLHKRIQQLAQEKKDEQEAKQLYQQKIIDLEDRLVTLHKQKIDKQKESIHLINELQNEKEQREIIERNYIQQIQEKNKELNNLEIVLQFEKQEKAEIEEKLEKLEMIFNKPKKEVSTETNLKKEDIDVLYEKDKQLVNILAKIKEIEKEKQELLETLEETKKNVRFLTTESGDMRISDINLKEIDLRGNESPKRILVSCCQSLESIILPRYNEKCEALICDLLLNLKSISDFSDQRALRLIDFSKIRSNAEFTFSYIPNLEKIFIDDCPFINVILSNLPNLEKVLFYVGSDIGDFRFPCDDDFIRRFDDNTNVSKWYNVLDISRWEINTVR